MGHPAWRRTSRAPPHDVALWRGGPDQPRYEAPPQRCLTVVQPASAAKWCDGRSSRSALTARLPTRRCCLQCAGPVAAPGSGTRSARAASAPKWRGHRGRAAARPVRGSGRAARPAAPPSQSSPASLAPPRTVGRGVPYARAASPPKPRRCRLCGLQRLPRRCRLGGRPRLPRRARGRQVSAPAAPAARQPGRRGRAPQRLAPHLQAALAAAPSKHRAVPLSAHPAYPRLAPRCRRRAPSCAGGAACGWGRTGPVHPAPAVPPACPASGAGPRATAASAAPPDRAGTRRRSPPSAPSAHPRGRAAGRCGAARTGFTAASICVTSRVLLPAACCTSCSLTAASSPRLPPCSPAATATAPAGGSGAEPLPGAAASVLRAHVGWRRLRSSRSKACCNCAALLSDSEPSCNSSCAPRVCEHSRIALMRRQAAAAV